MKEARKRCRRPGLAACTGLSGLLLALGLSPQPAAAALSNLQLISGSVEATAGLIDISIEGDDLSGNSASVTGNSVAAFAGSNMAGINTLANSGAEQSGFTVSDNQVTAVASGNSAGNIIDVGATVLNAAPMEAFATAGASGGSAVAAYAINNAQVNTAAIGATMNAINIGTSVGGGLINGTASVSGNGILASAGGNTASNSIVLASAMGMPSAALTSSQINTASITAMINGATIGVNAGGLSNSPVTVTGNTISASAVGNSAINHIGIGN